MRLSLTLCLLAQLKYTISTEDTSRDEDSGSAKNSYYSTKEMQDMCLKEWTGKTQEVQDYFDQLPSKEFKENSEDLKFKLYYERKGLEDVDSTQIYNITPQVRTFSGSEHTIEVNDSYVPKYRPTTSEEIRIEEEGTFNSDTKPDTTLEHFESQTVDSSEIRSISESKSADSSGSKPKGKKGKKGKEKWPKNMDPKEVPKKKAKEDPGHVKRKELIKSKINGIHHGRIKIKTSITENKQTKGVFSVKNLNQNTLNRQNKKTDRVNGIVYTRDLNSHQEKVQVMSPNMHVKNTQGRLISQNKNLQSKLIIEKTASLHEIEQVKGQKLKKGVELINGHKHKKDGSLFDQFMGNCQLRHKRKHHHQRNPRARRRPLQGDLLPRPFL
ncbi:uncharacterized protein LOC124354485 isoform X1 [Homalodisca vitripennis]|uniref:uncharacterized protein LOC124354485 isoform X1 n=1 Tax=Homalodisca vitripennis TaxID=197043 RepID=UPI001EEC676E|nr:uncharacterized protein LOC124354485 isoform X1 [Homalodisca vitripennis]